MRQTMIGTNSPLGMVPNVASAVTRCAGRPVPPRSPGPVLGLEPLAVGQAFIQAGALER